MPKKSVLHVAPNAFGKMDDNQAVSDTNVKIANTFSYVDMEIRNCG
ncbi:MAG: hypothetical protein ABIA92_00725 [Patescibacteria group bacterium]